MLFLWVSGLSKAGEPSGPEQEQSAPSVLKNLTVDSASSHVHGSLQRRSSTLLPQQQESSSVAVPSGRCVLAAKAMQAVLVAVVHVFCAGT